MKPHILLLTFFMSGFLSAQVSFEAKVSKKRLGINERLRIDFTMNTDGDNFEPPSFKNFTVVGGPASPSIILGSMEHVHFRKATVIF